MKLTKEEFRHKVLDDIKKRKKQQYKMQTELDRYCSKRTMKYFVDRTRRKK
jgi:hypothetical protein